MVKISVAHTIEGHASIYSMGKTVEVKEFLLLYRNFEDVTKVLLEPHKPYITIQTILCNHFLLRKLNEQLFKPVITDANWAMI